MATIDEVLNGMSSESVTYAVDEVLFIDPITRQVSIPGDETIFGVEGDGKSERKYFQCPRYVGNDIDLAACLFRVNFQNANGENDFNLIDDVTVSEDGKTITFSWELSPKVTAYKGQVKFVICATRPSDNTSWHTTQATGLVLVGLEPDASHIESETADGIAQLVAMVDAQTAAVEAEGATQVNVVKAAAEAAEAAAVAKVESKGASTLASIPGDYTAMQNAVNGMANAIRGKVSGATVFANDVSPIEHNPSVWIHGKNIFDGKLTPGYYWGSKDNLVDNKSAVYRSFEVFLKKGTYTLSTSAKICVLRHYVDGVMLYPLHYGTEYTFTAKNDGVVAFSIRESTSAAWNDSTTVQLERGVSATDYVQYIDPSTVKVKRCGKNLLPRGNGNFTQNGLTFTTNSDGSVTVSGTATASTTHIFTWSADLVNGERYILSGCPNGGGTGETYVLRCYNSLGDSTVRDDEGNGVEFLFENARGSYNFAIVINNGVSIDATFYPMLRLASVADGSYEPYNSKEYIPESDGAVGGVTSLSPNMTILTNTDGVMVECEYNRDTNKVIAELLEKIAALVSGK